LPGDKDDSEQVIMLITLCAPQWIPPLRTDIQEDQELINENGEELDQVDGDFNNIGKTVVEGDNNPNVHAQQDNRTNYFNVEQRVTLIVRVLAARSLELMTNLA
jgi:hypothetical protein